MLYRSYCHTFLTVAATAPFAAGTTSLVTSTGTAVSSSATLSRKRITHKDNSIRCYYDTSSMLSTAMIPKVTIPVSYVTSIKAAFTPSHSQYYHHQLHLSYKRRRRNTSRTSMLHHQQDTAKLLNPPRDTSRWNSYSSSTFTRSKFTPHLTYTFDDNSSNCNTLYVPLTSYCNTYQATIVQLRGSNFRIPPTVVASLCRIRDMELISCSARPSPNENESNTSKIQPRYTIWCRWLDTQESYQLLPAPLEQSFVSSIPSSSSSSLNELEHRPLVQDLMDEIQKWYEYGSISNSNKNDHDTRTIVVAGEGEATLRLRELMELIQSIRKMVTIQNSMGCNDNDNDDKNAAKNNSTLQSRANNIQIRIMTNGLLTKDQAINLLNACCATSSLSDDNTLEVIPIRFSVNLMTSDPIQYNTMMQPLLPASVVQQQVESGQLSQQQQLLIGHFLVSDFIRTVAQYAETPNAQHISLEITSIDRPNVIDQTALSKFVTNTLLGGIHHPSFVGIRYRKYFD